MQHVDALSRINSVLTICNSPFVQNLANCQLMDESVKLIHEKLTKNKNDPFYELRDNIVYRKYGEKLLFYVPAIFENEVIRKHHEIGHTGANKVIEMIKRTYWFPNMAEKVGFHIKNCMTCLMYQPQDGRKEGFLNIFEKFDTPFNTIHADHLGPLEITSKKNRHLLAVTDGFTKYTRLFATRTTNTIEAKKHLENYFKQYSVPRRLITDRGSCFTSKQFKNFMEDNGIQHVLNATHSPQSNGQVERMNRTLLPILAKLTEEGKQWDTILAEVEFVLNNTINRSIQTTPSRALFGVDQRCENDDLKCYIDFINEEKRDLTDIRNKVVENNGKLQMKNKMYFDKKRKEDHKYNVGDYVVIKNNITEPGVDRKLSIKYRGPYVVQKVLPRQRYLIGDIPGQKLTNKTFSGIYAPFNMKPFLNDRGQSRCQI